MRGNIIVMYDILRQIKIIRKSIRTLFTLKLYDENECIFNFSLVPAWKFIVDNLKIELENYFSVKIMICH